MGPRVQRDPRTRRLGATAAAPRASPAPALEEARRTTASTARPKAQTSQVRLLLSCHARAASCSLLPADVELAKVLSLSLCVCSDYYASFNCFNATVDRDVAGSAPAGPSAPGSSLPTPEEERKGRACLRPGCNFRGNYRSRSTSVAQLTPHNVGGQSDRPSQPSKQPCQQQQQQLQGLQSLQGASPPNGASAGTAPAWADPAAQQPSIYAAGYSGGQQAAVAGTPHAASRPQKRKLEDTAEQLPNQKHRAAANMVTLEAAGRGSNNAAAVRMPAAEDEVMAERGHVARAGSPAWKRPAYAPQQAQKSTAHGPSSNDNTGECAETLLRCVTQ